MRVINLILHIITAVLMLPDLLFIGIAFLWGVQYLKGLETVFVPMFVLLFFLAFTASSVGGIVQLVTYKPAKLRVYTVREMIIHGLSAVCFLAIIIYSLVIISDHTSGMPEISVFSTETSLSLIDLTGFSVGIAGMIVTIVGSGIKKRQLANASART